MDTLLDSIPTPVADVLAAQPLEPLLYDAAGAPARPVTFDAGAANRVLPTSRLKDDKNVVITRNGVQWVPIFCANCGVDGGLVLASDWERVKTFAFYLCDERRNDCAAKWSPLVDTRLAPDEVFWEKIQQAQLEAFGRQLTAPEIIEALKDETHILAKLARERGDFQAATL